MCVDCRHIHEPEIIEEGESAEEKREGDESSDEGELSDEEIERRRLMLRQKLLSRKEEEVSTAFQRYLCVCVQFYFSGLFTNRNWKFLTKKRRTNPPF